MLNYVTGIHSQKKKLNISEGLSHNNGTSKISYCALNTRRKGQI
jgi:hypothetical protein